MRQHFRYLMNLNISLEVDTCKSSDMPLATRVARAQNLPQISVCSSDILNNNLEWTEQSRIILQDCHKQQRIQFVSCHRCLSYLTMIFSSMHNAHLQTKENRTITTDNYVVFGKQLYISFSLVDQLTIIFGNENAVFFMLFVVTLFTIHSPN